MPNIPARILYPGMVIGLLLMSVGFVVTTVIAAHSDGGPQVVDDYYQKSVDYEQTQALRGAAENSGWKVDVRNLADAVEGRPLVVSVKDARGRPVSGLKGTLELRRPERSAAHAASALSPVVGAPGTYEARVTPDREGLWDVTIRAERGSAEYLFEVREELPQ